MVIVVNTLHTNAGDVKRSEFDPWVRKIPWQRKWQPTPRFLRGKSHGQGSLAGYSPWGHKESDTTEQLSMYTKAGEYVFQFAFNNQEGSG